MELSTGWVKCFLGDIVNLRNGYAFKSTEYQKQGIPIIRISDINDGVVEVTDSKCIFQHDGFDNFTVGSGDILIAMSGATTGKFGIYKGTAKAYQNQRVGNLKPVSESNTSKLFIFYLLYSLKRRIEKDAYGGAQPNISGSKVESIEIALPPLNEQRRIVAKIEELFSELDKGIENLKTAQAQLKVYRQALLKHAFEGKLTVQWRAEKQDKLETADSLLKRIQQDRTQRYQKQLADWKASGKQGSKPRASNPLPPLSADELAELPELPEGWGWVKVDSYCAAERNSIKAGPFGSSLKKEFYVKKGYKVYGQEQVISGDWKYGDYFIDEARYLDLESCKVKPFDILISLVGTLGKVLVLPENITPGVINPRLVKISPNMNSVVPEFFKYYFESAFLKGLYKLKTHGATMDVLNLGIIQELPFPICSLKEQRVLIQEIEARLSEVDQLELTIATSLQQAEALRQSILKKAFSGQLVPQDPHDEPASALLARIRAEREQAATPKRKGKGS